MTLIFKVQKPTKGHATCSGCGKFLSKKIIRHYRFCPYLDQKGKPCKERL